MSASRVMAILSIVGLALIAYAELFGVGALAEACRMVNVPLGIVVAATFYVRVNDAWHRYGIGGRLTRLGVFAVLCVVAYGSAEAYVTHASAGPRSIAMTLALATTALGLALIPTDDA